MFDSVLSLLVSHSIRFLAALVLFDSAAKLDSYVFDSFRKVPFAHPYTSLFKSPPCRVLGLPSAFLGTRPLNAPLPYVTIHPYLMIWAAHMECRYQISGGRPRAVSRQAARAIYSCAGGRCYRFRPRCCGRCSTATCVRVRAAVASAARARRANVTGSLCSISHCRFAGTRSPLPPPTFRAPMRQISQMLLMFNELAPFLSGRVGVILCSICFRRSKFSLIG